MELATGTESRPEYLAFELAGAARKLVEAVMLVRPGENVAITADTAADWRVVDATARAVYAAGAVATVLLYETRPTAVVEPPAPVAAAVARSDVWIEFAYAYVLHTPAFRAAMATGCRYICLTGMDVDMMVKTVGRVDYPRLVALGETLGNSWRRLTRCGLPARRAPTCWRTTGDERSGNPASLRTREASRSCWGARCRGARWRRPSRGGWCSMGLSGRPRNSVCSGNPWPLGFRGREDALARPLLAWLQPRGHPPDRSDRRGRAGVRLHRDGVRQPALELDGVYVHPQVVASCRAMGLPGY